MLIRADNARVEWDSAKKRWEVHIAVGGEVVKRPVPNHTLESGEDAIRQQAVATAHDEGYELNPQNVEIVRSASVKS